MYVFQFQSYQLQSKWTHDPFGAEKEANGNIYARGSQVCYKSMIQIPLSFKVLF